RFLGLLRPALHLGLDELRVRLYARCDLVGDDRLRIPDELRYPVVHRAVIAVRLANLLRVVVPMAGAYLESRGVERARILVLNGDVDCASLEVRTDGGQRIR